MAPFQGNTPPEKCETLTPVITDETDMLCYLAIPRVMAKRGIKFPWGEVAAYIGDHVSGNALLQHMSKETKKRAKEGRPIPEDREPHVKGPSNYQIISAAGFGDRRTRAISDIQARRASRTDVDDDDDDFGLGDGLNFPLTPTPSRTLPKRKTRPIVKTEPDEDDPDGDFDPDISPKKRRVNLEGDAVSSPPKDFQKRNALTLLGYGGEVDGTAVANGDEQTDDEAEDEDASVKLEDNVDQSINNKVRLLNDRLLVIRLGFGAQLKLQQMLSEDERKNAQVAISSSLPSTVRDEGYSSELAAAPDSSQTTSQFSSFNQQAYGATPQAPYYMMPTNNQLSQPDFEVSDGEFPSQFVDQAGLGDDPFRDLNLDGMHSSPFNGHFQGQFEMMMASSDGTDGDMVALVGK